MDQTLKLAKIIAVIVVVLAIGAVLGWYGTRSPEKPDGPVAIPFARQPSSNNSMAARISTERLRASSSQPALQQGVTAVPPASNVLTNWEGMLDDVLGSDKPEREKARELLAAFPRLPPDGQVEVADHLVNLVEDEQYPMLGQYLTNTALPEEVLDTLLSDLLNRPNELKLPLLVGVARDPKNPKAPEAKDLLELYLEEDYGQDWPLWASKVQQWLKDNPEE